MKSFNNVEMFRGNIFFLFFLISFIFFIVSIVFLKDYFNKYFLILLDLLIILILYLKYKKRFFYRVNFKIFGNKFSYNEDEVLYEEIKSYRIDYMGGATLNLKLKSGEKVNLSSNNHFCKTENFVNFCKALDKRLMHFEGIVRKKSFTETRFGLYFVYLMTFAFLIIILMSIFTEKKIKIATLGLIITSLATLWGAIIKRKK